MNNVKVITLAGTLAAGLLLAGIKIARLSQRVRQLEQESYRREAMVELEEQVKPE